MLRNWPAAGEAVQVRMSTGMLKNQWHQSVLWRHYLFLFILFTGDPPVITQSRASTPQLVSGNVVLSCGGNRSSYASTRTGDITWDIVRQSDGLSLPTVAGPNARFSVYNDSSGTDVTVMITINNVTKADSGDYICTISSDQGSATAIIPLNISKERNMKGISIPACVDITHTESYIFVTSSLLTKSPQYGRKGCCF